MLPAELLMSVGLAAGVRPGVEHRARRRRPPRRRRRQRGAQHHPADRRLARHGAAQHHLRRARSPATSPATLSDGAGQAAQDAAFIHGYHVAFVVGAGLLTVAFLAVLFLINAKKEDLPADESIVIH